MESFGEYLKSLREERGKSLEEISLSTKIAITNLQFLEQDRYELLPPRVFVKGFIRSYVEELGLNPEEALRLFDRFTKVGEVPSYEGEEHPLFPRAEQSLSLIGSPVFTIVLTSAGAICLVILLLTAAIRLFTSGDSAKTRQPAVTTVRPPGPRATPTEVPNQPQDVNPVRETPRPQAGNRVLEIKAMAKAWVRVQSDSGPAQEMVMSPGDSRVFHSKENFQVQTGNAGGLRFRLDGKTLQTMGKDNQTLAITFP